MTEQTRILILDPDDQTVADCAQAFSSYGWRVDRVCALAEALKLLRRCSYDIAILDLMLPDAEGTEAWSYIRTLSPTTVGIITTASASLRTSIHAQERGIIAYLQKPLHPSALCDLIERFLHSRRLADENVKFQQKLIGLKTLVSDLTQTVDSDQALKRLLGQLPTILQFDWAVLYLLAEDESDGTNWVQRHHLSQQDELTMAQLEFIRERSIETIHSRQPRLLNRLATVNDDGLELQLCELGLRSLILVPISGSTEAYGALAIVNNSNSQPAVMPYEVELLVIAGQMLALTLRQLRESNRIRMELLRDRASGAFTPAYLNCLVELEVARRERSARPFSLLLLERASGQRNDPEAQGQSELRNWRELAQLVRSTVRRSDTVAQLAAWRLAILLPETAEPGAQGALQRITRVIEAHLSATHGEMTWQFKTQVVTPTPNVQSLADLVS